MSLNNAKITKLGILFGNSKKNSLIVPLRITQEKSREEGISNTHLNRALYLFLAEYTSRYSFLFNKNSKTDFELLLIAYFTSQQKNLLQTTQNTLKRLNLLLSSSNCIATINSPQEYLEQVKNKLPKNIIEIAPQTFKITTSQGTIYQTLAKFKIKEGFDKRALFSFLKDFLVILPEGQINIDVNNAQKRIKDKLQFTSEISITIDLSDSDLTKLQQKQKQLKSLLKHFSTTEHDRSVHLISLVNKNDYQVNYGKIVFNQGWNFVQTDIATILDFSAMLEILSLKISND